MTDFEPKIVAFVCNWCTYAGADLTGTSRIKYAPNVRALRLPCTGRIDFMLLLQAFGQGADGVIVSGCHPGDCHYTAGNFHARRRWILFRRLLDFLGIDVRRVHFSWISAAEGAKWAELVNDVVEKVRALGPYERFPRRLNGAARDFVPLATGAGRVGSAHRATQPELQKGSGTQGAGPVAVIHGAEPVGHAHPT